MDQLPQFSRPGELQGQNSAATIDSQIAKPLPQFCPTRRKTRAKRA
jgi:hypothetical protein